MRPLGVWVRARSARTLRSAKIYFRFFNIFMTYTKWVWLQTGGVTLLNILHQVYIVGLAFKFQCKCNFGHWR